MQISKVFSAFIIGAVTGTFALPTSGASKNQALTAPDAFTDNFDHDLVAGYDSLDQEDDEIYAPHVADYDIIYDEPAVGADGNIQTARDAQDPKAALVYQRAFDSALRRRLRARIRRRLRARIRELRPVIRRAIREEIRREIRRALRRYRKGLSPRKGPDAHVNKS